MIALFRGRRRNLVAVVGISLILLVVIHQLSYMDDFALASRLSESMDVIKECPRTAIKPVNNSRLGFDSGIPNIIHQIWKNSDVSTYSRGASHDSWKTMFEPMNYTVKLWTDNDLLGLIQAKYSWLLPTYEGYSQNIQRADVARLVVVHAEGGMYADLDVHPKSAERILCLQHLGLQGVFAPTGATTGLSNHFFMAEQGSEFLKWTLHEAKRRGGSTSKRILLSYLEVFWSTGPLMVTSAFRQYAWVYSGGDHRLGVLDEGYRRSVIGHAAGRSWHKLDGQLLNFVADNASVESLWVTVCSLAVLFGLVFIMIRRCGRPRSGKGPR